MSTVKQEHDKISEGALERFLERGALLKNKKVLVGLDGFVDQGFKIVKKRWGPGEAYETVATIAEWAQHLAGAAGKSMNAEMIPLYEHMGGNGPFLAKGLGELGLRSTTLGALGDPILKEFRKLEPYSTLHTLGAPGRTHALEFADGKLLLGVTQPMEALTPERLLEKVPQLPQLIAEHDALALVNWTMLPHMTAIFKKILGFLKSSPPRPPTAALRFFFDLADPQKRPPEQLREALYTIAEFQNFGNTAIGLNLKEAQQVCQALSLPPCEDTPYSLRSCARGICKTLSIHCVLIHPLTRAACATAHESFCLPGVFEKAPLLTTGAGDHLNAGFLAASLAALPLQDCLAVALLGAHQYVCSGSARL